MKALFAMSLLLLGALLPAGSARAQTPDERALLRLEDGWARALMRRDTAYFRRTLHPAYVYSDEQGLSGKEQVIAQSVAASDTVTFAGNEQMKARVYGTTGVVTGILVTRGRGARGPFHHRYRYTDSWIKRGGHWIMIASQDYDIPSS